MRVVGMMEEVGLVMVLALQLHFLAQSTRRHQLNRCEQTVVEWDLTKWAVPPFVMEPGFVIAQVAVVFVELGL